MRPDATADRPAAGRRQFLAAALGWAAAAPLAHAAEAYQIGCWTRPWAKMDYTLALDGIAAAGFRYAGLMTMTLGGKPFNLTWESTPESAEAMAKEVSRRGLKTISLWAGSFPFQKSVADGVAGLRRIIDNAAICKAPSLLLGGVGKPEQAVPYYKCVSECCDYAASKGVKLMVKPHGGSNSTGPECRRIIESVGHKNFGIFYDPGNIYYYSDGKVDPVDDAPSVDGLVTGMIVKDFKMPKEVLVTPGTGMVRFGEVFARLRKGGFRSGPVVVECLDPGDLEKVNAEARKAYRFVSGMLKGKPAA
jgi:sugar phosphate isomerase/epimerase